MAKTILLALALATALPAMAQAKTFKLTQDDKPIAEITVPDNWSPEASDGGVEATSADQDTYVAAEVVDKSDLTEIGRETAKFLADQKIKLKPETKAQKEVMVAGLPTMAMSWDATDEAGPARVGLRLIKVRDDKVVALTIWHSGDGAKTHGGDVDTIEASIKPVK